MGAPAGDSDACRGQYWLDGDVAHAKVMAGATDRFVAGPASERVRGLDHGGERVERCPMMRAGGAEYADGWCVKRCRLVKDRIRLWKQGVRALVMARCCALHNLRVRLNPWVPMISSG